MVSRRVDRSTGEVYSFTIPDPTSNVLMDLICTAYIVITFESLFLVTSAF